MTVTKCGNCSEEQDHICTYCGTDVATITSMGSRPEPEGYGFNDLFKSHVHQAVHQAITNHIEDWDSWGDAPIDNLTAFCFEAASAPEVKATDYDAAYAAAVVICKKFDTEDKVFDECQKLYDDEADINTD